MAGNVFELSGRLVADTRRFIAAFRESQRAVRDLGVDSERVGRRARDAAAQFGTMVREVKAAERSIVASNTALASSVNALTKAIQDQGRAIAAQAASMQESAEKEKRTILDRMALRRREADEKRRHDNDEKSRLQQLAKVAAVGAGAAGVYSLARNPDIVKRAGVAAGSGIAALGPQIADLVGLTVKTAIGGKGGDISSTAMGSGVRAAMASVQKEMDAALGQQRSVVEKLLASKGGGIALAGGGVAAFTALTVAARPFFSLLRENRQEIESLGKIAGGLFLKPMVTNRLSGMATTGLIRAGLGSTAAGALGGLAGDTAMKASGWAASQAASLAKLAASYTTLGKTFGIGAREAGAFQERMQQMNMYLRAQAVEQFGQAVVKVSNILRREWNTAVKEGANRIEQLELINNKLGAQAGYLPGQLDKQVVAMKSLGIETKTAMSAIGDFIKQNIPLQQGNRNLIEELARTAQNSAVLTGAGSSETLQRLVWGISTGQTDVVRTAGLNVSFEQEYARMAQSLNKSAINLSEFEKAQARVNAVVRAGVSVQGAYEESLLNAGKRLGSLKRVLEELHNNVGRGGNPVFEAAVEIYERWLKKVEAATRAGTEFSRAMVGMGSEAADMMLRLNESIEKGVQRFDFGKVATKARMSLKSALADVPGVTGVGVGAALGAAAQRGLNFAGVSLPITPVTGALAGLVAAQDDLRAGLGSSLGQMVELMGELAVATEPLTRQFEVLIQENGPQVARLMENAVQAVSLRANVEATKVQALSASGIIPLLSSIESGALKAINSELEHLMQNQAALPILVSLMTFFKMASNTTGPLMLATALKKINEQLASMMSAASQQHPQLRAVATGFEVAGQAAGSWQSRLMKTIGVMGAVSLAIGALTFAIDDYNKKQGEVRAKSAERFGEMIRGGDISKAIEEMERLKDIRDDYSGSFDELANSAAGRIESWISDKLPGDYAGGYKHVQAVRAHDKATAEIAGLKDAFKEAMAASSDARRNLERDMREIAREAASTREVIEKAYGQAAGDVFSRLTISQQTQLDQMLQTLEGSVAGWRRGMVSLSEAMLEKEKQTFPTLQEFYKAQFTQVASFWNNMRMLQEAGLDPALLQDLVAQGPEQIGDLVSKTVAEALAEGGRPNLKAMVDEINQQVSAINAQQEQGRIALGQGLVVSAKNFTLDTPQAIREAIEQRDKWAVQLGDANKELDLMMRTVDAGVGEFIKPAEGVSTKDLDATMRQYLDAVARYQDLVQSGETDTRKLAEAFDLVQKRGDAFYDASDDTGKDMAVNIASQVRNVAELQGMIQSIQNQINNNPTAKAASEADAALPTIEDSGANAANAYVNSLIGTMGGRAGEVQAAITALLTGADPTGEAMKAYMEAQNKGKDAAGTGVYDPVAATRAMRDEWEKPGVVTGVRASDAYKDVRGTRANFNDFTGQRAAYWGTPKTQATGTPNSAATPEAPPVVDHAAALDIARKLNEDRARLEAQHAKEMRDFEVQVERQKEDAIRQAGYARIDLQRQLNRALEDAARQHARALEDIEYNYWKTIRDIDRNQARDRQRLIQELYDPRRTPVADLISEGWSKSGSTMARYAQTELEAGTHQNALGLGRAIATEARDGGYSNTTARIAAARQLAEAIRAEAAAAAEAGMIGKDLNSVTAYMQQRFQQVAQTVRDSAAGMDIMANSVLTVQERLQLLNEELERSLNLQLGAVDAVGAETEAYWNLNQAMMDRRALLTNNMLREQDRFAITKRSVDALNQYVRAVVSSAQAQAAAGELDPAQVKDKIQAALEQAKAMYPEMAAEINRYQQSIMSGQAAGGAGAEGVLSEVENMLATLPSTYEVAIAFRLDDAAYQAAIERVYALEDAAVQYQDSVAEAQRALQRQTQDIYTQNARAIEDAATNLALQLERIESEAAVSRERRKQDMEREFQDIVDRLGIAGRIAVQLGQYIAGANGQLITLVQNAGTAEEAGVEAARNYYVAGSSSASSIHEAVKQSIEMWWLAQAYAALAAGKPLPPRPDVANLTLRIAAMTAPNSSVNAAERRMRMDSGGILPPGTHVVQNLTGQNERILTDEQWSMFAQLLSHMASGGGADQPGRTVIQEMNVTTNKPPRDWLEEGVWYLANGIRRSEWED